MDGKFEDAARASFPVQDIYHRNDMGWGRTPAVTSNQYYWSFVLESTFLISISSVFMYKTREVIASWQTPVSITSTDTIRNYGFNYALYGGSDIYNLKMFLSNSFYNEQLPMVSRLFACFNIVHLSSSGSTGGQVKRTTVAITANASTYYDIYRNGSGYKYINYICFPFAHVTSNYTSHPSRFFFHYLIFNNTNLSNIEFYSSFISVYVEDFEQYIRIDIAASSTWGTWGSCYYFEAVAVTGDVAIMMVEYYKSTAYAIRFIYQSGMSGMIGIEAFLTCPMYGLDLCFYCGLTSKTATRMMVKTLYQASRDNLNYLDQTSIFPSSILGYNLNHTLGVSTLCASPQYPYISACNMEGIAVYPSNAYNSTTTSTPGVLIAYTNTDSHLRWYIWQIDAKMDYNYTSKHYSLASCSFTDLSNQEPWASTIGAVTGYYGPYCIQMNASCTQMIVYMAGVDGTTYTPANNNGVSVPANISTITGIYTFHRTSPTGTWKMLTKSISIGNVLDAEVVNGKTCRMFFTYRHPIDPAKVNSELYRNTMNLLTNVPHMIAVADYLKTQDYNTGGDRWLLQEIAGSSSAVALYLYNVKFSQL